jgi:DNA-binding NarL/FixJ family response regulator
MVVDDHPMWRDAVARDLTEAGYDVVATAADGAQALRVAGATRPDVVVLDLQLPDMSGVKVTRGLQAAHPAVRVLVLSASGEQQDVLDAVKAGAVGYLLKSAARPEFLDAVRRTASGDAVFTPGLAALVLGEFRRLSEAPPGVKGVPQLSERETEILRMVATGMSYKQIATRLVLSHRTVQNHVQNTLGKLQLHNRVELVRYAIEHGLAGEFEVNEDLPPSHGGGLTGAVPAERCLRALRARGAGSRTIEPRQPREMHDSTGSAAGAPVVAARAAGALGERGRRRPRDRGGGGRGRRRGERTGAGHRQGRADQRHRRAS